MPLKIIILHGLNNNLSAFLPLKEALSERGFDCHLLCLPGHGENPREAGNFSESLAIFDVQIKKLISGPYAVVAFSQGAMYFQLWIRSNPNLMPIAQILLAPAFAIRSFAIVNAITKILPLSLKIKSQMPGYLKRYPALSIRDYRILIDGVLDFEKGPKDFSIPSLILIDPKDELVDAQKIKVMYGEKVKFLERPYLKGRRPGKYHIVFHPDFFSESDWRNLLTLIEDFLILKPEA